MNNEEIQQKVEEYELDAKEIRVCDKLELKQLNGGGYALYQDGRKLEGVVKFELSIDNVRCVPTVRITLALL